MRNSVFNPNLMRNMLAAAVLFFSLVGCSGTGLQLSNDGLTRAPAFTALALDGRPVALSEYAGKVVLLDFSASWCSGCRQSLPHLQSLHDDQLLGAKGLVVLAIDEEEDASTVKSFAESTGCSLPVLLDSDRSIGADYHANSLPTSVIIGRDGTVRAVISGWTQQSAQQVSDAVNAALAEPIRQ